jgi:hypothetical protein
MKIKTCSHGFAIYLLLILCSSSLLAQQEKFDLLSFSPPPGWARTLNNDVAMYSSSNEGSGAFCLISIYKSLDGSGDISTDFTNSWNTLAATRLSIADKPKAEKGESENGWDSQSGSASFTMQGSPCVAVLTTLSGYNRMINILVITNNQSYLTELEPFYTSVKIDKPVQPQMKTQPAQINSAPGTLNDYIFTPPPGWTKEVNAGEIVLRGPDKVSILSILPMQPSSGDLENDMKTIFWQVFSGWKPDPRNPDEHISLKGTVPEGWSYFKDEIYITKEEGDKQYFTFGFVFLAKLDGQVAIVAGSYPSATNLLDEHYEVDWPLFFHSLKFKNFTAVPDSPLAQDILGEWLTAGNSGATTYTFAANNRYGYGSAYSTTRGYSSYQVIETTTTFAGDGKYSLNGNEMIMISDKTQKSDLRKVRVFWEKQYGDWQKRIGLLNLESYNGKPYELTMAFQK